MERNNFVIGKINDIGSFSMATCPVQHTLQAEAIKEAERLARANKGSRFVVLMVAGTVEAIDVIWK